jgi:hypothetical protein
METEFSLKERKKAKLRIGLLNSLLDLLRDRTLGQISVESICRRSDTNKVTFFQNFKHKEQLLDYFVCRWSYERCHELETDTYSGLKGVQSIFDSIAGNPLGLKIMVSLVSYYTRLTEIPDVPAISDCEYAMFNAKAYARGVTPRSLDQIFMHYVGQLSSVGPRQRPQVLKILVTVLYGVPVHMYITGTPASEMSISYSRTLEAALAKYL